MDRVHEAIDNIADSSFTAGRAVEASCIVDFIRRLSGEAHPDARRLLVAITADIALGKHRLSPPSTKE